MQNIKQVTVFILALVILSGIFPSTAFAHNAYFLEVLIDENSMSYRGSVLQDKVGAWFGHESKHIEAGLGDFSSIKNWDGTEFSNDYSESSDSTNGKEDMIFTFPSVEKEIGGSINHATVTDVENAYNVTETLIPNLNQAIRLIHKGRMPSSANELMSTAEALVTGAGGDGWSVEYSGNKAHLTAHGNEYKFDYRVKKGYDRSIYPNDAEYINWQQIVYQGNYNLVVKNSTVMAPPDYREPGTIEKNVVEFFEDFFNDIRSLLGLYGTDELIFNNGIRSTKEFYYGVTKTEWMQNSNILHLVFQGFAWIFIAYAIVKQIIDNMLATANITKRVSLFESITDILITALLLGSCYFLMNALFKLNWWMVDVFSDSSTFHTTTNPGYTAGVSGTLAGVVIQFFYFIIALYLNASYIIRGIIIALLVATAPLFIVSISFGGKWKGLFGLWAKEFAGNLFIQSIQAFSMGYLLSLQVSTRGIESMIIAASVIPITEFFRALIFQTSGGISHKLGASSLAKAGLVAGGAMGAGMMMGKLKSIQGGDKSSGTKQTDSGHTILGSGPEAQGHGNTTIPTNFTRDALSQTSTATEARDFTMSEKLSAATGVLKDNVKAGVSNIKENPANIASSVGKAGVTTAKNAAKAAAGVAAFGFGTGSMLALGEEPGIGRFAGTMVFGGAKVASDSVNDQFHSAFSSGNKTISNFGDSVNSRLHEREGYGGLIGAETLGNGDIAMHKDMNFLHQNEGIKNVSMTEDKNTQIVFDKERLTQEQSYKIDEMISKYKTDPDALKGVGVENAYRQTSGNPVVVYNNEGMDRAGFVKAKMVGNKLVETKRPTHPVNTNFLIDTTPRLVPAEINTQI